MVVVLVVKVKVAGSMVSVLVSVVSVLWSGIRADLTVGSVVNGEDRISDRNSLFASHSPEPPLVER